MLVLSLLGMVSGPEIPPPYTPSQHSTACRLRHMRKRAREVALGLVEDG